MVGRGFLAVEIGEFLWVSDGEDQLGFWVSRSMCYGGGLWVMGFGVDWHGGVGRWLLSHVWFNLQETERSLHPLSLPQSFHG